MPRLKANTTKTTSNGSVDNIITSKTTGIDEREAFASSTKGRGRGKTATIKSEDSNLEKPSTETVKAQRGRKKLIEKEIEFPKEVENISKNHEMNSSNDKVNLNEINALSNSKGRKKKTANVENEVNVDEGTSGITTSKGRKRKETANLENEVNVDEGTSGITTSKGRKRKESALRLKIKPDEETNAVVEVSDQPTVKKRSNIKPKENRQEIVKEKKAATKKKPSKTFEKDSYITENHVLPGASSEGKSNNRNEKKVKLSSTAKKNKNDTNHNEEIDTVNNISALRKQGKPIKKATAVKVDRTDEDSEKQSRSRKRGAIKNESSELVLTDENNEKPSKIKKIQTAAGLPLNSTHTNYIKSDFDLSPKINAENNSTNEQRYNLKISSWNVAGLRSWLKKDGLKYLDYEEPDIFCMQEIKCTTDQLPDEAARIPGYHPYWLCMPGGYAGVAIYSKIMPINVEYGIGNPEFDSVGRIITAEYEKFFLINVYVPNSGRKLVNLEARMRWENLFQEFVKKLDVRKAVIICGDMNVSHQEIDLANPKSNLRSAGFTKEERGKMTELLSLGFVDTFRYLYPERRAAYTYWTYMANARARNVGWRLDYFITSERFVKRVVDHCIRSQVKGSDHCPITLYLNM